MGEPQTLRYVTRGHALEEQFLRPLDLEPRHHPVRALAEPARELSVEWNGLRRAALAISGSFGRRWNVLRMNASAPHNCRSSGGALVCHVSTLSAPRSRRRWRRRGRLRAAAVTARRCAPAVQDLAYAGHVSAGLGQETGAVAGHEAAHHFLVSRVLGRKSRRRAARLPAMR